MPKNGQYLLYLAFAVFVHYLQVDTSDDNIELCLSLGLSDGKLGKHVFKGRLSVYRLIFPFGIHINLGEGREDF